MTSNLSRSRSTWSVKLGPLSPGLYTYRLLVNGTAGKNPKSPNAIQSSPTYTSFFVDGSKAALLRENSRVPHGKLAVVSYPSKVTGTQRSATVWTPPGYRSNGRAYPTLYLVYGGGGGYLDWVQQGGAAQILDNLYAQHCIAPMVVVMPDGNLPGSTGLPEEDQFPKELTGSLQPASQGAYNVSERPADNAYAGLSLGGPQVFNTLLTQPGRFAYLGDFSSGYIPNVITSLEQDHANPLSNRDINRRTKLFRIYIGNEPDIAYENNIAMRELFDRAGIRYEFAGVRAESAHNWRTWQYDLADFAPLIFPDRH